jgi:spoIIIJ-associated protein
MMSELKEFEGRTAAEAAINACDALGTTRSQLKYDVKSDEGEGLDRRVVISVDVAAIEPAPVEEESRPERPRRERNNRRERGGRSNRRSHDDIMVSAKEVDEGVDELPEQLPEPKPALAEGDQSERGALASQVLKEVLEIGGFSASVNLIEDTDEHIEVELHGSDLKRLIGERGETLLAIQFLLNRMVSRKAEGDQLIVLDAGGYRERRQNALESLAKKLAGRAEKEQKVVKISPMSPHDRRVVHQTLSELESVRTESTGDGLYRNLLIIPAGFRSNRRND